MLTGDMLRRSAERFPNKAAILWQDQSITYQELDQEANRLANAVLAAGIQKGEKVGVLSRNRLEYGILFFGLARSGAVMVNISTLYQPDDLAYVLTKADVTTLFYEAEFKSKLEQMKEQPPLLKRLICIEDDGPDESLKAFVGQADTTPPQVELAFTDPFCMTYTGGTTGKPKGVLVSHQNRYITAHTVAMEEALDERDVVGIVTPLFHVAALNIMFQPAILVGATCTFQTKWDVGEFARMVQRTKMTAAFMVPTQIAMVVSDPDLDIEALQSWRKVSFAGAPMPDWVQKEMFERVPNVLLTQIYGQSEMGVLTALRAWYLPEKLGSIGRQAYNVDVALVRPEGVPEPQGEVGEIASRGPNVMLEYYKETEQTKEIMRNGGWFVTGDLGVMDEDGFISLVDRAKDMFISGGENVYPKEIEDAIFELEEVAECAVFGIPDDRWGEVGMAYIELKKGCSLTEEQVIEHCRQRLAEFKRPRAVKFVDGFVKTPMGKIQKNLLREPYWADREKKI